MPTKQPLVRKKVLWCYACLVAVLVTASLWVLHWIEREPLRCLRWRFTANDGTSFYEDIWSTPLGFHPTEPWGNRIANLSGQLEVSVPVSADLPWYKLPFQGFRPTRRIPFKNGLIHGSVLALDQEGLAIYIQQYREGKEHGISCFFNEDGSFSHLVSSKNGVMDGPSISCGTNGLLYAVDHYSKGKKNGPSRKWSETGALIEEGFFTNDLATGRYTHWRHHNGAKSDETQISTNNTPSETMIWAADGKLIGTGTYKEHQLWNDRYFRPWNGYFVENFKGYISLRYYREGECLDSNVPWLEETTSR